MDSNPSFASYLHNPWAYPSIEEQAAMLVFKRKERFVEGYCHIQNLNKIIQKFFSQIKNLYKYGLTKYYEELKTHVINNNLIGLILIGTTLKEPLKLNDYKTVNNKIISLNTRDISRFLIKEYIKRENIDSLCSKTPNFDIYYKSLNESKN